MRQTPVSLKHLAITNKIKPTKELVIRSAKFLYREVPIRLIKRHYEMMRLPATLLNDISPVYRLSKLYHEKSLLLKNMIVPNNWENVEKFTYSLEDIKNELDQSIDDAMQSLYQKIALDNPNLYIPPILDEVLNRIHLSIIGLRVLIGQHKNLFDYVSGFIDKPIFIVNEKCCIGDLVKCVTEDTRAFSIDKNGDAPNIEVIGDATMICVESHVHFIMRELVKNSIRAVINNGTFKNDNSVKVLISCQGKELGIRVSDTGGGLISEKRSNIFRYFYSTATRFQPTYTYSGGFGAQFDGLGVGLPVARLYARYMGGDIHFECVPGYGSDVFVYLNRFGSASDIDYLSNDIP